MYNEKNETRKHAERKDRKRGKAIGSSNKTEQMKKGKKKRRKLEKEERRKQE